MLSKNKEGVSVEKVLVSRTVGLTCVLLVLLSGCGRTDEQVASQLVLETREAAWVAYQDGEGAWQALARGETGTQASGALPGVAHVNRPTRVHAHIDQYATFGKQRVEARHEGGLTPLAADLAAEDVQTLAIEDAEGRYGVATLCVNPERGDVEVEILYYTLREVSSLYVACSFDDDEAPADYALRGRIKGVGEEEIATVFAGTSDATVDGLEPAYTLELPQDSYDVVAAKYEGASAAPNSFITKEVTLDADKTLDLDFTGPDALVADVKTIKVDGVKRRDTLRGSVTLVTANGTLVNVGDLNRDVIGSYAAVPAAKALEDALYTVQVDDVDISEDRTVGTARTVLRTLMRPEDLTLTLPPPFGPVEITVQAAGPYLYPAAQWQAYAGNDGYNLFYRQRDEVETNYYIFQSPGWLRSDESYSYTLPDWSALADWRDAWSLRVSVETDWSVYAFDEEGTYGEDGFRSAGAETLGTLVP